MVMINLVGMLFNLVWFLVFFAIVIWILAFLLKRNLARYLGWSGENFVSRKLHRLDPKHYRVLNDLLLPSLGNLQTTQIDHVVVSNFGIFCIETKNYKGWIFGSANQERWTQVIYHYKSRLYNPLWQNYAHIKALEARLRPEYPTVPNLGFIAFPRAEKLKISGTDRVGHVRDVIQKIESYTSPALSDIDRDKIVELLQAWNIQDREVRKEHNRGAQVLKK